MFLEISLKRLGLVVNPVAGIGGRVGLKGSDSAEIQSKARELGAVENSPSRTVEALKRLYPIKDSFELITYPREMGEDESRQAGFNPKVIGRITSGNTSATDTKSAAFDMVRLGVDLILFAGGDGTARDIYNSVDGEVPVLGIPAGVKIHSGVYAISPAAAGELAARYLSDGGLTLLEAEVMDIDEEAFRDNRLSARLYGYLKVPREETMMQTSKESAPLDEKENLRAIAKDVVEGMDPKTVYIIGPGSTTTYIAERLGFDKTLLGVDVIQSRNVLARDVNERQILDLINCKKAKIIVTVIGGQGFIFGRGNQQISPTVIKAVGKENIVVVATPAKLGTLHGKPLIVDTGDIKLDCELSGYIKIITDYGRRVVYQLKGGLL